MKKKLARFLFSALAFICTIAASVVGFCLMAGVIDQTLLARIICALILVISPISVIQLINVLYQKPLEAPVKMTKEEAKEAARESREAAREEKEKKRRKKMYDTEPLPGMEEYDTYDDYKEYDE